MAPWGGRRGNAAAMIMGDHMHAPLQESTATSLLGRPAAYSVITETLRVQQQAAPRSRLQRFFGVDPRHPDAISWFCGALGELRVGELLAGLEPEWAVLHSVPVGSRGSDIDHVLIGPGGVFTLNTKRHLGAKIWLGEKMLLVAGQKTDHLRNARHEAQRAARLLSEVVGVPVAVTPMLVLVGTSSITVRQRPADVVVLTDGHLLRWLARRPAVLAPSGIAAILAAAADARCWRRNPDCAVDAAQLAEFEQLVAEVEQARTRRLSWAVIWVGLALVAAIVFVPPLLATLGLGLG